MKIATTYPVLVEGRLRTSKVTKLFVLERPGTVDIPEVDGVDAPVVAIVNDPGFAPLGPNVENVYRQFGGRLYRPVSSVTDFVAGSLTSALSADPVTGPLYHEIVHELGLAVGGPRGLHFGQSDIIRALQKHPAAEGKAQLAVDLAPDAGHAAASESWRDLFERRAASLLIVDGVIHALSREPILVFSDRYLFAGSADAYDVTVNGRPGDYHEGVRSGFEYRYRSALDYEAAFADFEAVCPGAVRHEQPPVDVLDPSAFTLDIDALEMDRLARCMLSSMSDMLDVLARQRIAFFQSLPDGLVEAWLAARRLLGSYDPFDGVPESVAPAVRGMITAADEYRAATGSGLLHGFDRVDVEDFFGRFETRGISYEETIGLTP